MQEQVVFKRSRKRSSSEVHSTGAWKVAFADFMIALMALFLVLWIMSVVDEKERVAIVSYLNSSSVFDGEAGNPFDTSTSIQPFDFGGEANDLTTHSITKTITSFFNGDGAGPESDSQIAGQFDSQEQLAMLAEVIDDIAKQISAQGNVMVDVSPQGLRIILQDDQNRKMFSRGGSVMTPFFEDLLLNIAPVFNKVSNQLIISGHTDSTQFHGAFKSKSNWELSASRANIARQTLVLGGMPEERVLQITGMSDRALLNQNKPEASENRRIEIFLLTTTTAQVIDTLFGTNNSSGELSKAKDRARSNQPVTRLQASAG